MRNFIFLLLTSTLIFSCSYIGGERISGNGQKASQQRSVSNFTGVEASGPFDVLITQGDGFSVKVEGDQNLLEYVDIYEKNGTLYIDSRDRYQLDPRVGMTIFVTAPLYNHLEVAGSGSIRSQTKLHNASELNVHVGGSGAIVVDVDAPRINTHVAGSGNIRAKGTTKNFSAEIAGSGEIHAFDLLSENSKVEIAGSGDVELFASKTLDVSIAGSGDVQYKGGASVKQSVAGSGDIRKVD